MKQKKDYSKEEIEYLEMHAEALIYLVHQLAVIQEGLIVDAKEMLKDAGDYRFNIKQDIDRIHRLSSTLRERVWKRNPDDLSAVEKFGDEADDLKMHIEKFFFEKVKRE